MTHRDERPAARARHALPLLAAVRVASPCAQDWAAMAGDARVRRCDACATEVHNLSAMTRDEAEGFLAARPAGRVCVRFHRGPEGAVTTRDDAERARRGRPERRGAPRPGDALAAVARGGALAALVAVGGASLTGCGSFADEPPLSQGADEDRLGELRSFTTGMLERASPAPTAHRAGPHSATRPRMRVPRSPR